MILHSNFQLSKLAENYFKNYIHTSPILNCGTYAMINNLIDKWVKKANDLQIIYNLVEKTFNMLVLMKTDKAGLINIILTLNTNSNNFAFKYSENPFFTYFQMIKLLHLSYIYKYCPVYK